MSATKASWWLALSVTIAAVAYDRAAEAAAPKRALMLVIALVALSVSMVRAPARRTSRAFQLSLAFVGWSAVTAAFGKPSGLLDLGVWAAAIAIGASAAQLGRAKAIALVRIVALAVGAIASSHLLIAFARGGRGFLLHGGQGNPNWLGLLLSMTLPLSLDATLSAIRFKRRAAYVLALSTLLQLPAIAMAHSRVAWVAVSLALLLMIPLRLPAIRWVRVSSAAALLIVVALTTMRARAEVRFELRDEATALEAWHGRTFIWTVSADAARRALPFGAGLGSFGDAYLVAQGDALSTMTPREASRHFLNATTAHDDWLQTAVESGPLATLLLAAACLLAVRDHLRSRFRAGASAVVAFVVCALGDSPLRQPAIALVLALVIAALPARRSKMRSARWHQVAVAGSIVACAFLLSVATRSWLGARVRTAAADAMPDVRLARLEKSVRIDPSSGEGALELGLARLELGDAEGALIELRRAKGLFSNMGTAIAIGNAERMLGHDDLAELAYREALALDPGSLRAHGDLADVLCAEGRFDQAEEHARIALSLSPGDARMRGLLDRIERDRVDALIGD